ncbi:signal peptidase I [Paenibacillus pasadenensis]|uniref:signal peptidase I n=1 Tax=Paenibacillus pasadenensis TaxID=217090 RepID=UPI0004097F7C|nr:signal peptidase I [Paenibacillus pasadenensis]
MTEPAAAELRTEPETRHAARRRELSALLRTAVVVAAVVLFLNRFVLNLSIVEGDSMQPTLHPGDWLLVSRLAGDALPIRMNDVVILRDPRPQDGSPGYLVKRVVGLPGDVVELRQGKLLRNGLPVAELYADPSPALENFRAVQVEPGHYFVLGDNRQWRASRDSRTFGSIDASDITGRAELLLWPFVHAGRL